MTAFVVSASPPEKYIFKVMNKNNVRLKNVLLSLCINLLHMFETSNETRRHQNVVIPHPNKQVSILEWIHERAKCFAESFEINNKHTRPTIINFKLPFNVRHLHCNVGHFHLVFSMVNLSMYLSGGILLTR